MNVPYFFRIIQKNRKQKKHTTAQVAASISHAGPVMPTPPAPSASR